MLGAQQPREARGHRQVRAGAEALRRQAEAAEAAAAATEGGLDAGREEWLGGWSWGDGRDAAAAAAGEVVGKPGAGPGMEGFIPPAAAAGIFVEDPAGCGSYPLTPAKSLAIPGQVICTASLLPGSL